MTTICEMTGDLPCVSSLWDAKDEAEFQSIIQSEGIGILHRPYCVRSFVEDMMKDEFSLTYHDFPQRLTIGDLSIVIDGMFALVMVPPQLWSIGIRY